MYGQERNKAIHRTATICIRINTKRVKPLGWLLKQAPQIVWASNLYERSISETKTLTKLVKKVNKHNFGFGDRQQGNQTFNMPMESLYIPKLNPRRDLHIFFYGDFMLVFVFAWDFRFRLFCRVVTI